MSKPKAESHGHAGRHFTVGRKKFDLKTTICPGTNFFS